MKPFIFTGLLAWSAIAHAADRKPNFIFVIADDHRWDAMGAVQKEHGDKARYPWFETPNMDRLAADGVRFRNAFITHSICSPGRAGFLTGQYTHTNGVMNNHTPFPESNITHASLLRDAGYKTAYFGKWHMGNHKARPGFQHYASFINLVLPLLLQQGFGAHAHLPRHPHGERQTDRLQRQAGVDLGL